MEADRFTYPAMLPPEIAIWRGWLALHEAEFTGYDYNVRLGNGTDPGPTFNDATRRMWIMNTQLRLDAVAQAHGQWWIFEVKQNAGAGALSQVRLYCRLWRNQFPGQLPVNPVLVTNSIRGETAAFAEEEMGVKVYVVTPSGYVPPPA